MTDTKILEILNSAIGNEIPDLHKVPMITSKYNGKIILVKRGEIEVEYKILPEMTNPLGLLHGGMQCTLIDDLIGVAVATLGYDNFSISINLQINYLGKAKVGDKIKVKAKIIREGRNLLHASAKISDINDKTISIAQSDLLRTQIDSDYIKSILDFKKQNNKEVK
jgi:uncharacterized protein (TIGR00369 family)